MKRKSIKKGKKGKGRTQEGEKNVKDAATSLERKIIRKGRHVLQIGKQT